MAVDSSVHEYARFHGLTTDYTILDPLDVNLPIEEGIQQFDNDDDLSTTINATLVEERPHVDSGILSLLQACTRPPPANVQKLCSDLLPPLHRVRDSKLELPLLRTDHEFDMRRFKTKLEPRLDKEHIPFDDLDEEAGEGLQIPKVYYEQLDELWQSIKAEKLHVTSEAFLLMGECLKSPLKAGEAPRFDIEVKERSRKAKSWEPITPPLLPMSPEYSPYEPSSDAARLDLLSIPTSPLDEEIKKVEHNIFRDDQIDPKAEGSLASRSSSSSPIDSEELGNMSTLEKGDRASPSPLLPKFRLPYKDKVDVPLLVAEPDPNPPWEKKVSIGDALAEIIPNLPKALSESGSNTDDEIETFFEETIAPIAIEAERRIEQEHLDELDTTLRVKVPIMDFAHPIAPWDMPPCKNGKNKAISCIDDVARELEALEPKKRYWCLQGHIERELSWIPFPTSLGDTSNLDQVEDDRGLQQHLDQPGCIDTANLVWKPEGIRFLDATDDSDEEEMQQADFANGHNVSSLLRKRKLELDEETANDDGSRKKTSGPVAVSNSHPHSEFGSLEIFMGHRTGKPEFSQSESRQSVKQAPPSTKSTMIANTSGDDATNTHKTHSTAQRPLPAPNISVPLDTRQFFLSTILLSNRTLARRILKLYPTADIIERDWTLHETQGFKVNGEADIIISPSTGLLYTNLHKIKQRALPGQEKQAALLSPIQARILATSHKYEQLFVLVSQNVQSIDVSYDLTASDCEALSQFNAFVCAASSGVSIVFVAGGEEQLASTIVSLMIQQSMAIDMPQMIAEESAEEEFLSRAGCNAFAAQMILHGLQQKGEAGLGAFIRMSWQEKVLRHEKLLGGRKCLMRLHEVLEASW